MQADYSILTSSNRKLPLPIRLEDMQNNEEVVSTNAPYGMLFVVNKILKSYFTITQDELETGSLVCVPLFEDFKDFEKTRIINELNKLDKMDII